MDGTFDIAPAPFKQVYLIHAEKFGQGLPVAFCLLPNKRGRTYLELFERPRSQMNRILQSYIYMCILIYEIIDSLFFLHSYFAEIVGKYIVYLCNCLTSFVFIQFH
ncbi:unnamed protein product [Rotaria socialis]